MIRVFLSYAHEDFEAATRLYHDLNSFPTVDVWFDKKSLIPGQRWQQAIRDAIRSCDFALVLLSRNSVTKRGYYQKEIRIALEVLDEHPESDIFLVPVRLDDCPLHFDQMAVLQYVDMFPSWSDGLYRIAWALRLHSRTPMADIAAPVRITAHQARFRRDPRLFYFVNLANRSGAPIELTHVWYEDRETHIQLRPMSRPLPVRLDVNQPWCTWLPIDKLPDARRDDAYDKFRVRLSTGEVFGSSREDTIPPFGSVPGGPIDPRDF